MKLIIAEKPSLARNIAAAIGNAKRANGYIVCDGYIVTWAFGHLFSLCDIEDYTGKETVPGAPRKWTMEGLPCYPETFRFSLRKGENGTLDDGVRQQFETIKALAHREDVDTVINAGDADREGEIIVRICIMNAFGNNTDEKSLMELASKVAAAAPAAPEPADAYNDCHPRHNSGDEPWYQRRIYDKWGHESLEL